MADFAKRYKIEHYPFVQKLFQNPAYTEFWSGQAVDKWLAARPLTVPTLIEVGQWDQEDSYGGPAVSSRSSSTRPSATKSSPGWAAPTRAASRTRGTSSTTSFSTMTSPSS